MPAKAKVTREMIVDAAFAVARETGAETISARTVSERLHCSTQPVMYHFATIEELKRTVYAKADQYHSDYLMRIKKPQKGAALGIGMNYIRFAIEEPHLFRFLFQSDYFNGSTLLELIDAGIPNIVCTQPFGCLPNHVVGKGMVRKIKDRQPQANIVCVDYDPGATRINQENRIKLMLANARLQAEKAAKTAVSAGRREETTQSAAPSSALHN